MAPQKFPIQRNNFNNSQAPNIDGNFEEAVAIEHKKPKIYKLCGLNILNFARIHALEHLTKE